MEFDIKERTHYLVMAGSHSYGMATAESDVDVRGWCIPPKNFLLSYHKKFEQNDEGWKQDEFPWLKSLKYRLGAGILHNTQDELIDSCIYNLSKFMKLAADCNPNIIELLFVDEEDVLVCTRLGKQLRDIGPALLSTKCKYTFSGYAFSQLKRINTHRRWLITPPTHEPTRQEYNLPEFSLIPADQRALVGSMIDKQVRLWLLEEAEVERNLVSNIRDGLVEMFAGIMANQNLVVDLLDEEKLFDAARIAAGKKLSLSDSFLQVLQQEKQYRGAHREWKQYNDWKKNRNESRAQLEKDYGYDTKHGSHLVRLLLQCEEILEKGTLTVKDSERAERLLAIRKGELPYDELIAWSKMTMDKLDKMYEEGKCAVPKKIDAKALDNLYTYLVESALHI